MSLDIMKVVWDTSKHKNSRLLAMLCFADHADEDGISWPGYAKLAKRCRLSENRIGKLIKMLEDSREVFVNHGGGRGRSNRYFIALGRTEKEIVAVLTKRMKKSKGEAQKIAVWLITGNGERPDVERKSVRKTPIGKRLNDGTFTNVEESLNDGENALNDGENAQQTMVKTPTEPSCEPSLEPSRGHSPTAHPPPKPTNGTSLNPPKDHLDYYFQGKSGKLPTTGMTVEQIAVQEVLEGQWRVKDKLREENILLAAGYYLAAVRVHWSDYPCPPEKNEQSKWINEIGKHLIKHTPEQLKVFYLTAVKYAKEKDYPYWSPTSITNDALPRAVEAGAKPPMGWAALNDAECKTWNGRGKAKGVSGEAEYNSWKEAAQRAAMKMGK